MSTGVATSIDSCFVDVSLFASVTVTVNVLDPGVVGVPVIAPLDDIDNPRGSDPAGTLKEYGPVPPVAATVWEYADPVVPAANDEVVIDGDAEMIVV